MIEIKLYKMELDYDIGMITHVVSNREIAAGATNEQGWNYSNTDDESGEVNLIARFEENAIHELSAVLARYLVDNKDISDNILDSAYHDTTFTLNMPETFNKNYTKPLRSAAHDFVVSRVLYDWFLRTKPDEASIYRQSYEDARDKVIGYINRRTGFTSIKPWPAI